MFRNRRQQWGAGHLHREAPEPLDGDRTLYSDRLPNHSWETHGAPPRVNEAPEALLHDGRAFVTYSASGCWTPDYPLGLLWARAGANLLSASSWHQLPRPVLSSNTAQGVYGAGSNSFLTSPNGKQAVRSGDLLASPRRPHSDPRSAVDPQPLSRPEYPCQWLPAPFSNPRNR
ncbi:MAG: family 43 glycosylhydrolase [Acidimicrobiales bacterium]